MDASALAKELDNLEKSWASLDWWLNFWTILVVVGVAVELVVLAIEYRHDWRDFRRGIIHSPERPSLLVFGLGLVGAAMVAVGVAGEFRVHIRAGKIETDMRDTTRQLVSIADGDAAVANSEAGRAKDDAGKANVRAAKLEVKAEALRKANLQAAEGLEVEKRKRAELAASLLPRTLYDQSGLQNKLASAHALPVVFEIADDNESLALAEQINFVLANLHWGAMRHRGTERLIHEGITISTGVKLVPPPVEGRLEYLQRQEESRTIAEAAVRLLVEALGKMDAVENFTPASLNFPPGTLMIAVGSKPNHVLETTLRELGTPEATPLSGTRTRAYGSRASIPEETTTQRP